MSLSRRFAILPIAVAGLPLPAAADFGLTLHPSAAQRAVGERQRESIERRMTLLCDAIDRLEAAGLPSGRTTFLRQDVQRVAYGLSVGLRQQGRLSPAEERSWRAMLDQIERKIARAQAEQRPTPMTLIRR
ncbi:MULTISPECIES: hypothetical protein [unclassified Sphingomonas]|jgi:hypothetical protein|uniref:hypothetical protein n=1 Tax=unclassified Sphingomonas TaxID=196159 RepID=UPI000E101E42|nr:MULTISPECIES: hypothetical protein [unclassified Sphingomonas]AXJ94526.1 hypothetical protein DM480_02500 [Sphingomonas sp. FARSPH]